MRAGVMRTKGILRRVTGVTTDVEAGTETETTSDTTVWAHDEPFDQRDMPQGPHQAERTLTFRQSAVSFTPTTEHRWVEGGVSHRILRVEAMRDKANVPVYRLTISGES